MLRFLSWFRGRSPMLQSSGRTRGVTMLRVCGCKGGKIDVAQMVAPNRGPAMFKFSLNPCLYPPRMSERPPWAKL